jgi:hypothetical protein
MPFANIRISKGSQVLHGWYIHPIPYEMSVKDFFIKLVTKEISSECNVAMMSFDEIERVEISETPATIATQVNFNCGIIELTTSVGIRVHYLLKSDNTINTTLVPQRNGLTILMENAHRSRLYLPTFSQLEKINRKQVLRNDITDWVRNHNGGWSTQSYADTHEKQFIVSLTETIWYINMHNHKKFEERCFHIPKIFLEFFDRANSESYKQ